jgi:hypothetical protein
METLVRDLRYSVRMLARAPGSTALAIATLALGIGANTAIFTVANSVLLRPLPYKDPGQLARISAKRDGCCCVSFPYFTLLAGTNHSFSGVPAYQFDTVNLVSREGAEQIDAERATGNFFDVLGAKPLIRRTFTPEEDQPGSLDSKDYTIIGVLRAKFGVQSLGRQPEIWLPRVIEFSLTTPARVNLGGMYYEAIRALASRGECRAGKLFAGTTGDAHQSH